jgi:uncharacterized Ntn-hydrolase superfamily protein
MATLSMGVGGRCPHFVPDVGVVLTMAYTDPRLGYLGVELLRTGYSAPKVLGELAASDANIEHRQLCVIDRDGNAVARTGARTNKWSGAFTEPNLVALGNNLTSERTATAMRDTFKALRDERLERRLMSALEAGRDAGGQNGGQLSATIAIYGPKIYPYLDLRVDLHDEPIGELRRVLGTFTPFIPYYYERPAEPEKYGTKQQWKAKWLEQHKR